MAKKILIISGSPVKDGNTAMLVEWFKQGAQAKQAAVRLVNAADLKYKTSGCLSCRQCQKNPQYECVIDDAARPVLAEMIRSDVIVMATPLYFYSPSAQLKILMDRMFSLYKWDNRSNTMATPLKGKTMVLLASAFEDAGLDVLEKIFSITAEYTGMRFSSLLVKNAGESGQIRRLEGIAEQAAALGSQVA